MAKVLDYIDVFYPYTQLTRYRKIYEGKLFPRSQEQEIFNYSSKLNSDLIIILFWILQDSLISRGRWVVDYLKLKLMYLFRKLAEKPVRKRRYTMKILNKNAAISFA